MFDWILFNEYCVIWGFRLCPVCVWSVWMVRLTETESRKFRTPSLVLLLIYTTSISWSMGGSNSANLAYVVLDAG